MDKIDLFTAEHISPKNFGDTDIDMWGTPHQYRSPRGLAPSEGDNNQISHVLFY